MPKVFPLRISVSGGAFARPQFPRVGGTAFHYRRKFVGLVAVEIGLPTVLKKLFEDPK
jgi:hypothetical protein